LKKRPRISPGPFFVEVSLDWDAIFYLGTISDMILAESKAKGIPPPGCTDPPQK